MSRKTKKRKKKKTKVKDVNIEQTLLKERQLFLFGEINNKEAKSLIREIIALDKIEHKPIALYINSPGGNVDSGFAIIDTIRGILSPVLTVIVGEACSMAGLISVAGDVRLMSKHAIWMAHEMTAGDYDYVTKIKDRTKFFEVLEEKTQDYLKEQTKLTSKDLKKAQVGELWLGAKECLEKGIVGHIVPQKRLVIKKGKKNDKKRKSYTKNIDINL